MRMRLTFYRDQSDRRRWRWTVTKRNGNIVAAATEGYSRRIDAVRNAKLVLRTEKMAVFLDDGDRVVEFDID